MLPILGRAQHYDWGDNEEIPHLLGVPPDGRPWAEWWWGTHPLAPSDVVTATGDVPLTSITGPLPYLVKLLAAARPLSLQVHPSEEQAQEGFRREEAEGLPLDHPQRTYRDAHAKPELLCALTEFEALCGVAPVEETIDLLARIGGAADTMRERLGGDGVEGVLAWVLRESPDMTALLDAASSVDNPRSACAARLGAMHPGDHSAALALLLHYVVLAPGEALYLGAGNLHAYLRGVGLEVMAASDNVVRVGLTTKHVDVEGALALVDTRPVAEPVVHATFDGEAWTYPSPGAPFLLRRYELDGALSTTAEEAEVWWCADGDAGPLVSGQAGLAGAADTTTLQGQATLFRVSAAPRS